MTTTANAVHYYVDGLIYPHFSFGFNGRAWVMLGNPGMAGDDGYDSPLTLSGTPEEFMNLWFGADKWR